jgi:hypothetical protein
VLNFVPAFNERQIQDLSAWSGSLMPQLKKFLRAIPAPKGRVRLALDAHATLAFAAGSILNTKSSRLVELEQRSPNLIMWSPDDATPQSTWTSWDFQESVNANGGRDLFCGVSLSRAVAADVRAFLVNANLCPAVSVFADLQGGPAQNSVRCGAHAALLAEKLAMYLQALRTTHPFMGARLHLFMAAPNGFCFELGRHAAVLGPLTLYEFDFERRNGGGYTASLSLP